MDHRQGVRALAAGRVLVGTALLLAPRRAGRGWIGAAAAERGTTVFARALGVRDLALGVGALQALDRGDPVRPWVQLGAVCDAVDLAATVLALRAIGPRRAIPTIVVAGAAAAYGLTAAAEVD